MSIELVMPRAGLTMVEGTISSWLVQEGAAVKKGDKIGEIVFTLDGKEVGRSEICAAEDVEKIGFFGVWWRMLGKFLLK